MAFITAQPEIRAGLFFSFFVFGNVCSLITAYMSEEWGFLFYYPSYYLLFLLEVVSYIVILKITKKIAAGGKFRFNISSTGEIEVKTKKGKTKISLQGKTVIVTGGNTGIGFATACKLAKWGANVYIACRSKGKAAQTLLRIRSCNQNAKFMELDLSSFKSIRSFAEQWGDRPIDILINNAGVMMCPFTLTEDGYELQFGTNHLGHFLLTKLLLPCILQRQGRIVNLSSTAHYFSPDTTTLQWTDLTDKFKPKYNAVTAYSYSKIANIYFTRQLNKLYGHQGVVSVCLHPGAVNTELVRHFNILSRLFFAPFQSLFMKSPEQGAQTSLYCAIHPDVIPGEYYADCKIGIQNPQTKNEREWQRLWDDSEKMVSSS